MFEGPVTGNIPEVLDNGEVTDGTHVTAGQLALALTPYAQVTDLAVNTAAAGNNAAAIQSLDDRVTAELASKLDSSALAPAIAPLATAAALATTDGQVAAHGSSIAALQSSLTTGLSNKADQSAFDMLEGVVATKSTPDGVDLKLSNYSTTAAMNGSIASANNATLATVAANYGLKTVVDPALPGHSGEDHAAGGGHQGGQRSAQLASRDAGITALQASKADAALLASYATNAALSASETALQSALDAILAELAALQLSGSGVVNAPAWAGFTTWELLRGSSVVRNLHFVAPLSAALANGDDTLSITADCYSTAGTDAAITAALLAYYTSAQVDALLGDYRTGAAQDAETTSAITGALLAYYTAAQVDALLGDYRTASAQDTQTAAIAGALLAYRTGPDQDVFTTNQITSALVAYRSAADQDTGSIPGLAQQSAGTLDLCSMQIRASAFEGESVSVTDLLADSLALTGSATLDGLTAQGNVGCDQLLCNDVNCTDVFTTGAVAGATLTSTGAVSGSSLSISGAASVGLLSSAAAVGDVSTGILTASGAATAASFAATGALTGATLTITGAASAGPLDCESLDCTFTATSGGVSTGSVVCGDVTSSGTVSAPQLFASNTLTVTNTSDFSDDLFLTKNWAGWSKLQVSNNSAAPDSGPELRLLGNQARGSSWSGTAGRTSASSS